jgi:hypothetical protein
LPLLKAAVAGGQRFLLTTSWALPGLAASLTSSLEAFTLWPLAQAEREGSFPGLIDACFQGDPGRLRLAPLTRQDLLDRLLAGGYPEAAGLAPAAQERWFHGYLDALVQGRLRDLTDLREVHHLLRLLASPDPGSGPARRCRDLLADCHVLASLPVLPEHPAGDGSRARWWNDAALQAHVLGMGPAGLATQPGLAEPLLATFAVMELVKTAPWSGSRPALAQVKVGAQDLILLEDHRRQLVAFAVSAAATVTREAFHGLRALRERVGERLVAGIVLHAGGETRAAGPGFWSVPFQALWAPKG